MSWSFVAGNPRHINFDVEPVRTPVFCEICFAAGRDLNSRDPFSCILSTGIESAARVVSLVKLTVIDLDNIWHDNQLKNRAKTSAPKLQPKVFMIQMNLDTSKKVLGES
jgi:hypothetical protein